MPPRRQPPAAQPLAIETDVAPRRTTRANSGTSGNPPAAGTSEPTQHTTSRSRATTSQQEPPGFAPVAAMGSSRNLNMSNLPPVLEMPSTPARQSLQPLVAVVPQTPARQAMNRLITQMSAQAVITSPGPRFHAPGAGSDGESEPDGDPETSDSDPETFPVHRLHAWRPRPMTQGDADDEEIVISLNSDDENTSPVHASPQSNSALRQPHRDSNTAEPVPSRQQHHSNKWLGFSVDADNFAWAGTSALEKSKSPDCQYFFGQHTESRAYKCRLCSKIYVVGSSLTTRRTHLQTMHSPEYLKAVAQNKWENKLPAERKRQLQERQAERIPFSSSAFLDQLVKVIVSNDLSINLIESRDFRDLLLMLRDTLQEQDIPHRTKIRSLIIDGWTAYYIELAACTWEDQLYDGCLEQQSTPTVPVNLLCTKLALLFDIRGAHSGQRMARIIFNILDLADILHKVGHFTMDNASNNATFMTHLAILLRERGITGFDAKKNYIRCFAHIINLCSQAVIKQMEKEDADNTYSDSDTDDDGTDLDCSGDDVEEVISPQAHRTRKAGPMRRARKTVAFIRKGGQRRDQLLEIIKTGNADGLWTQLITVDGGSTFDKDTVSLSPVMVLPDVKTRWDSVFYMLRRLRYLQQPVVQFFSINREARKFSHPLENRHWNQLELMELILQQPHTVQTAMSVENTPILAATIPAFELFVASWTSMTADQDLQKENISRFIRPGLSIATKYYDKLGETDAYVISMFVNPSICFEWIKHNWSPADQAKARSIILAKLRSYRDEGMTQTESEGSGENSPTGSGSRQPSRSRSRAPAPAAQLAIAQAALRFRNPQKSLDFSAGASNSQAGGQWSAEEEMKNYMQSAIPPRDTTDIIGYWMNHGITTWPTVHRLFVDYAPIQATSVPSERVFSSSAETDTKRRNRISPLLMEALQMLKFNFKKSRLHFMSNWQLAPIADDEEDWLRALASETDKERVGSLRREVTDSFEFADTVSQNGVRVW